MTNEPQISPTAETKKKKGNPWIIVDKLLRRVETLVVAFRILLIFYCLSTVTIILVLSNGAFAIGFPTVLGGSALCLILTLSTIQPPALKKFHERVKNILNPQPNQVQTETNQADNFESLFTFAAVETVMSDSVAIDISGDCGDGGDGGDCGGDGGGDGGGCD
jgi:hypothetical protein